MIGLNLNITDSFVAWGKAVGSSFNLPSILSGNEGPTLVTCLLKAEVISFRPPSACFQIQSVQLKWLLMPYQESYLWFFTHF